VLGKWEGFYRERDYQFPYGETTSYQKAMGFLDGCDPVEDWGCGTAFAKTLMKRGLYVGIDGSRSRFCDKVVDLRDYRSEADGILMRHVLEHNHDWRKILSNALASFRRKLAIVIFTQFADTTHAPSSWGDVPNISFKKEDLTSFFLTLKVSEESLRTNTQFGVEHIFYVER